MRLELLALRVQPEELELQVRRAKKAKKVKLGRLAAQAQLVQLAQQEELAKRDKRDKPGPLGERGHRVQQVRMGALEQSGFQAHGHHPMPLILHPLLGQSLRLSLMPTQFGFT